WSTAARWSTAAGCTSPPATWKGRTPGRRQRLFVSERNSPLRRPERSSPMRLVVVPALVALAALAPLPGVRAGKDDAGVRVDKAKRTVAIDARVAPRKMEDPKFQGKIYPIEVIA